jgi:hypothetical protein
LKEISLEKIPENFGDSFPQEETASPLIAPEPQPESFEDNALSQMVVALRKDSTKEIEEFKNPINYDVSEESLSDLSESERYIMNEDEIELKSILWNEMNPDYDEREKKRQNDNQLKNKKSKKP